MTGAVICRSGTLWSVDGAGGWAPYCVLGAGVVRRESVDVMHGAGRRGSVA